MGEKTIIVNEKEIEVYRGLMQSIGLWDKGYADIKNDLNAIKTNLIFMEVAYDYAGSFSEKAVLGMRLLTYGESSGDLNNEDIEALFAPLSDMNHLTPKTSTLDNMADFVEQAIPMCFMFIDKEHATDEKTLRETIRMALCLTAGLNKLLIGTSIAIDFCLHSYGMEDWRDIMIGQMEDIIANSKSEHIQSMVDDTRRVFNKAFNINSTKFGSLMSVLLIESNEGEIDYRKPAELIMDMRTEIVRRGHKHDFLEFLDSSGFREFIKHVQKFHNISEEKKSEKDKE